MLTQEAINKLASIIKVDAKTLSDAIGSESETTVEIPDLSAFTPEELERRDSNIKKENYDSGKVAGVEILVKELKEEHGIEIEGKDARKFLEAFRNKVIKDADIKPAEKDAETERIIAGLKSRNTELETENNTLNERIKINDIRSRAFSTITKDYSLSKEKILHLMSADGYELAEEGGLTVFRQNGNIVRDTKTQDPVTVDAVFDSYATANNLIKAEEPLRKGRGTGSTRNNLSAPTTLSALKEQWEAEGKSVNSADFSARAIELAKDNPDFYDD